MEFKDFVYCIDSPWAWSIVLLVSLRAIFTCTKEKDYAHLAAFVVVGVASAYMIGAGLGIFETPSIFK